MKEQYGGTPLAWAIECGSKWIVELLLKMGAKVDYSFIPTFVSELMMSRCPYQVNADIVFK
jgi:hypothetical protein